MLFDKHNIDEKQWLTTKKKKIYLTYTSGFARFCLVAYGGNKMSLKLAEKEELNKGEQYIYIFKKNHSIINYQLFFC